MMKARDLKNSILQLAVEGKLVPQDPNDEPASMLLERIRKQKRQLIAEGKAKFPKGGESVIFIGSDGLPYEKRVDAKGREGEPVCIDDEVPFEVPESWGWMRLADALVNRDSERIPVSVADREKLAKVYDYYGASGVIDKVDSYLFEDPLLLIGEDGANLLARTKPIAFIARGKYWVNNHAHVLDGISEPYLEYIALFINSINLTPYVTGTAQPKMNQTRMGMILIPIPPENEQVRILAKVSELMPLVEEYGALEDERERLDAQLPEALRKSILREAVEGRLVPQNPADEPASELLARIRDERRRLVASGELKFPKGGESVIFAGSDGRRYEKRVDKKGKESEPVCIEDEIPFEIPEGWEWARLGSLATFTGGGTPDKGNPAYWNGTIPWASMKDIHGSRLTATIDSITEEGLASKPSISMCQPGQIIVSTRLIPGKTIVSDIKCAINQDLKVVNTSLPIEYLSIWFASHLTEFRRIGSGTTVPGIKLSDLESALVPLPPIAVQHRIAEKVNELLTLITSQ